MHNVINLIFYVFIFVSDT